MSSADLSVYLHFPFCASKCPYCDFYSATAQELGLGPSEYFDLVGRELEILYSQDERLHSRRFVTIYVGGGTPSLAAPAEHRRFLERLLRVFEPAPSLEWTVEVNPGTIGPADIDEFVSIGVNRFSIGVQSFHDDLLERLGRMHRNAQSRALLGRLAEAARPGLTWGIDLIFGVPGQTLDQWREDLDELIHCRPHHCSVYSLTVHDGTPFAEMERSGRIKLPNEEIQREMFVAARNLLLRAGYNHYELSNYALPGLESRHNMRYWDGDDYLGLGVAAHSFLDGERWANPANLAVYRKKIEAGELARVCEPPAEGRAALGERIMLGLRRLDGIDLADFKSRFGSDLLEVYSAEIARMAEGGWIEVADGRLRLTVEGLLLADAIMAEFF